MAVSKTSITLKEAEVSIDGVVYYPTQFQFDQDENENTQAIIGGTLTSKQGNDQKSWSMDIPITEEDFSRIMDLVSKTGSFAITLSNTVNNVLRTIALMGCRIPKKGMTFPADGMSSMPVSGTFESIQIS